MGSTTPGKTLGITEEGLAPSFSFSNKNYSTLSGSTSKITFLQRAFSVRVLLIGSFAFMILFIAGVMYGITSYRYNKL